MKNLLANIVGFREKWLVESTAFYQRLACKRRNTAGSALSKPPQVWKNQPN
jgi:hypothetical protein